MMASVFAADLQSVKVSHKDGRYYMSSVTFFQAPRAGVFDVLTDYEHFGRLSSVYREYKYLSPTDDGVPRVYTRVEGCILFFCQSMERTERLIAEGLDALVAIVEPEASDFSFSEARWTFTESGEGTLVAYEMSMQPSFWVPPLIGPYMIKRKLRSGGLDAIERIEALANSSTASEDDFQARGLAGFADE